MARAPKKNPTNAEIMAVLKPLVDEVGILMKERNDRQVIAEYVKNNPPPTPLPTPQTQDRSLNKELLRALIIALSAVLALATLIASFHGVVAK